MRLHIRYNYTYTGDTEQEKHTVTRVECCRAQPFYPTVVKQRERNRTGRLCPHVAPGRLIMTMVDSFNNAALSILYNATSHIITMCSERIQITTTRYGI